MDATLRYPAEVDSSSSDAAFISAAGAPAGGRVFVGRVSAPPEDSAGLVVRLVDGRILHIELQSRNDLRMVVIYVGDSPVTMESRIVRGKVRFEIEMYSL